MSVPRFARPAILVTAVAVVLTGCGSTSARSSTAATSTSPSVSTTAASAGVLAATDAWVKTVDTGMTAAFMTITNSGDAADTLVAATTPASGMVQLHEMVMSNGQMVMQQKKGGIPVPAHGDAVLQPGGNHIMFMDVSAPIKAGDDVVLTLTFKSGATMTVTAVAKDYNGANESYQPSPGTSISMSPTATISGMGGMSSASPSTSMSSMK
jgi:periplasmic copper chaperone A